MQSLPEILAIQKDYAQLIGVQEKTDRLIKGVRNAVLSQEYRVRHFL